MYFYFGIFFACFWILISVLCIVLIVKFSKLIFFYFALIKFVRADFGSAKTETEIKAADLKDENGKSIGEPEDIIRTDANANIVLIRKDIERIYRRSSKAVASGTSPCI